MIFDSQEEKDKYFSWLKSLKAGDLVIVKSQLSFSRKYTYSINKIKSITPTGRILIEFLVHINFTPIYQKVYFENGCSRGNMSKTLEEYTEEKAKKLILIPNATCFLNEIQWKQLQEKDPEMLLEIYEKVKGRLAKE